MSAETILREMTSRGISLIPNGARVRLRIEFKGEVFNYQVFQARTRRYEIECLTCDGWMRGEIAITGERRGME